MSQIFTLSDFTTYMKRVTVDAGVGQQVIDAVNQWIETRTHRCFGEIKSVTDERHEWSNQTWLQHQDVISVDSLTLGWPGQTQTPVQATAYFWNKYGRITFFSNANQNMSRLYHDYMHVSYHYGYSIDGTNPAVPNDLKLAALALAGGMYNYAINGNQQVVAASVGTYRLQYIGSVRGASNGMTVPESNVAEGYWVTIDSYMTKRA